jgi:hypothetical protein
LIRTKCFREKSPAILEDVGDNYNDITQVS